VARGAVGLRTAAHVHRAGLARDILVQDLIRVVRPSPDTCIPQDACEARFEAQGGRRCARGQRRHT